MKSSLADWAATEDDDFGYYMGEKRQRGGRKKRKKNREPQAFVQNWDDIYDPSRPNNYEEYRQSDEKILEVREWKDRLYAHRMRRSLSRDSDSDDYGRPVNRTTAFLSARVILNSDIDLQDNLLLRAALRRRRTSTTSLRPLQPRCLMMHLGKMPLPVAHA